METVVIDGIRYEKKFVGETAGCAGCAGDGSRTLCRALPTGCSIENVIWVEHESQPADEWQGYGEIKYVPSPTQELKAFFGGKDFPSEAEEEHFKALDEKLNSYDVVEKPKHYMLFDAQDVLLTSVKHKGIDVRDVIEKLVAKITSENSPGSVLFESDYVQLMQYLMRFMDKNGVEDLKKARWYLDKMIGAYGEI